jgi:hypothetical protein
VQRDPERERRFEPWPIAIAAALFGMVVASLAFYAIAAAHPDPVVSHEPRPGLER